MKFRQLPSLPRLNLTIRQRIVCGYLAMLGVVATGSAIGWSVGTYYQERALDVQEKATKERQFLEDLHVSILSVQPGKQLLPFLEEPGRFRQESQIFSARLLSVIASLERQEDAHEKEGSQASRGESIPAESYMVHHSLDEYAITVSKFEELSFEILKRIKGLLGNPDELDIARTELLTLIQSREFRDYMSFSDQLREWKTRSRQTEEAAAAGLGRSESTRVNLMALSTLGSLIIALLVAIIFSQAITKPVNKVVKISNRITDQNDFDIRIPVHQQDDEVGKLGLALNTLLDKVQDLLGEVNDKNERLETTLQTLHDQKFLFVGDKMSSLSQLVAGIAHEVNNPMTFIHTNIPYLTNYFDDLLEIIKAYEEHYPNPDPEIRELREESDMDFLKEDVPRIFGSLNTGTTRISQIVLSLRSFARMDEAESKVVDVHEGIDSTLLMLQHRLSSEWNPGGVKVVKHYGKLPNVECFAGQINQVFLNILLNALDALEGRFEKDEKTVRRNAENGVAFCPLSFTNSQSDDSLILVKTAFLPELEQIEISIGNNGPEISEPLRQRICDPFFTTKLVGRGTGMGMSICYQIITENHGGTLECLSPGKESNVEFAIRIPLKRLHAEPSIFIKGEFVDTAGGDGEGKNGKEQWKTAKGVRDIAKGQEKRKSLGETLKSNFGSDFIAT